MIQNKIFTKPNPELLDETGAGDCITLINQYEIIDNCVFDLRNTPMDKQDECIDLVKGSKIVISNCIFIGCKKPILVGNGDFPEEDKANGTATIKNCIFINCGRRMPEAQDGTKVYMYNNWIHNWGVNSFDVRTFATWAHHGASMQIDKSVYTRTKGLGIKNYLVDKANHLGEAYNYQGIKGIFSKESWISGKYRAIDESENGSTLFNDCYSNIDKRHMPTTYSDFNIDIDRAYDIICLIEDSMSTSTLEVFNGIIGDYPTTYFCREMKNEIIKSGSHSLKTYLKSI